MYMYICMANYDGLFNNSVGDDDFQTLWNGSRKRLWPFGLKLFALNAHADISLNWAGA